MDFNAVCRTCLGSTTLIPILKKWGQAKLFSATIEKIIGYPIALNKELPQNICQECLENIKDFLSFRALCRKTENTLLQAINDIENISNNPNEKDDRRSDLEPYIKYEIVTNNVIISENDDNLESTESEACNKGEFYNKQIKESQISKEIKLENKYITTSKQKATSQSTVTEKINNIVSQALNQVVLESNANSKVKCEYEAVELEDSNCSEYSNNETEHSRNETENSRTETELSRTTHNEEFAQINESNSEDLTNSDVRRVNCEICSKNLAVTSLRYHMQKKHRDVKLKCEFCESLVNEDRMEQHVLKQHGRDCSRCKYCQKEFDSEMQLKKHIAKCIKVTKINRKKRNKFTTKVWGKQNVECDVCHKKMQRGSLGLHKKIKHAGLGPVCDYCNKQFTNKSCIIRHMRAKHGVAKLKCSMCEFESATSVALENHLRRHRGEKPFFCEVCGARFHAAHLLRQHRQLHTTDRLFKCNLCPATFKRNNGVHTHRAMMHSDKQYTCGICAKQFSCRSYYARHMRTVHRHQGAIPNVAN